MVTRSAAPSTSPLCRKGAPAAEPTETSFSKGRGFNEAESPATKPRLTSLGFVSHAFRPHDPPLPSLLTHFSTSYSHRIASTTSSPPPLKATFA